ncbi:8205_t:CDS:2 [Ambispora gerdemannii]|uniref:8205_t:CDS:1 n=1 Tax=Ambispora gerdemannii TaxID=144530 RepID=A0A9N9F3E9_9GLOM|nr:8205_t:CDS:2 [Ambispora gerdemannii]
MTANTTSKRDLSKELLEIYKKGCDSYEDDRVIEIEVNEWLKTHSVPSAQIFKMIFERSNDATDYKTLLAFMYCLGIGTEMSKVEMFRYYLLAAEQGDPDGFSGSVDKHQAIYWYQRAFDSGYMEYSKKQLNCIFLKNS